MAMNENTKYLIALSHFPKFGPKSLAKLKKNFPQLKETFSAPLKKFKHTGLFDKVLFEFFDFRKSFDIEGIINRLKNEKIKILTSEDENFPELLKEIPNAPIILYYKGTFEEKDNFPFAIVGTRKNTAQGEIITNRIASELSLNEVTIVSGLALGIDTIAHKAAVKNKKRTIAVLGTGVDEKSLYPSSNLSLSKKIIENGGAVISEFPLGAQALRHHFPQRNRIISGLSLGTLVVEAGEKSGALITADYALDQNREVMAIPGNILSSVSHGPNSIIKTGATPITCTEDILEALNLKNIETFTKNIKIMPDSPEEKLIYSLLSHEPTHVNSLIRLTNLNISVINSTLTIMEMKGMVKNIGNMSYILGR